MDNPRGEHGKPDAFATYPGRLETLPELQPTRLGRAAPELPLGAAT